MGEPGRIDKAAQCQDRAQAVDQEERRRHELVDGINMVDIDVACRANGMAQLEGVISATACATLVRGEYQDERAELAQPLRLHAAAAREQRGERYDRAGGAQPLRPRGVGASRPEWRRV